MTLVFIRHAHRDTTDRSADNGLSEKGRKQSKALAHYLKAYLMGVDAQIFSSQKRRCVETVEPLAEQIKVKIQIHPGLIEQSPAEGTTAFMKRCEKFLSDIEATSDSEATIILCSHGDWLPVALKFVIGSELDFQKGACAIVQDGRLISFLQPEDLKRID